MDSKTFIELGKVNFYELLNFAAKRAGFRSLNALCKAAEVTPQNVRRWKKKTPAVITTLQKILVTAQEAMQLKQAADCPPEMEPHEVHSLEVKKLKAMYPHHTDEELGLNDDENEDQW